MAAQPSTKSAHYSLRFFLLNARKRIIFAPQLSGGFYLVVKSSSSSFSSDLSSSFANVYNWLCCTSVRDQPILAAIMNEYFDGEHLSPVKLTSVIEPLSLRRSSSGSRFQVMSAISVIFGKLADFFVMCLLFPFKR
ncbi:hypothetical protein [Synechococcus sp. SYN20]|uniref:hypothetical protein n=1 Tax=Synechococcus sp. SYN20 TaxID=1050714 RepID=UPI001646D9F7|nr:hypothetical protein [Synechococcus sp. SYN20]